MKELFGYLPQYVPRDSDFLSAFTASSVRTSLSFFFFLKMTYEDFSSLCETTVYHVYLSMNKPLITGRGILLGTLLLHLLYL